MHLRYDEETERFRAEFQMWLEANLPPAEERSQLPRSSADIPPWGRAWQRRLFDAGWLVPAWPPELGGRNATPVQQLVFLEEVFRREIPHRFNPQGMQIIVPSILERGTEEQKRRYVLPTLRAEISWCLGMSEPNAGSDLAALQTRAELFDDHFVVNGQKVWTSGAHHADFCFCFVRTDPKAPKHKGISALIIDMKTTGVSTRPLPELTNPERADFNEVFFTDVVVPHENLVGGLNDGWSIAGGSLAHERGMLWVWQSTRLDQAMTNLVRVARIPAPSGRRLADDPLFRDRAAAAYIQTQALRLMGYRGFAKFAKGMESPEHSVLKLMGSELERRLALEVTEAMGVDGVDMDEPPTSLGNYSYEREHWVTRYLRTFSNTIAGGTSEIQRNVIAERVLGLPRARANGT